jgi:hypothetical protein
VTAVTREGAVDCDELLVMRIKSIGERAGGPPPLSARSCLEGVVAENAGGGTSASTTVLVHAIIGVRAETPHLCEEKTTKLDAVPVAGTNRLLLRIRSKTSPTIAPPSYRK